MTVPFVARAADARDARLLELVGNSRCLVALTGAGCSTASGIPDYRDANGEWKHKRPVQFQEFVASVAVRQRYWARSLVGWTRMAAAKPNAAHQALATLEAGGRLSGLITQNVDGLHSRAGSRRVIDLHGRIDRVVCLQCGHATPRAGFQAALAEMNPGWRSEAASFKPDGDADLGEADYAAFQVPACNCGGLLKPDVVFFGEHVPRERVAAAYAMIDSADALLIVGSSLMVWSGLRFVRRAAARGVPIAAVNRGRTRGDELIGIKVEGDCGEALKELAGSLGRRVD